MNQKRLVRIMIVVIAAMLLGSIASRREMSFPDRRTVPPGEVVPAPMGSIQDCPEHWYINRMPNYGAPGMNPSEDEYFIYKGMRRELMEFDMSWVEMYCAAVPEYTY